MELVRLTKTLAVRSLMQSEWVKTVMNVLTEKEFQVMSCWNISQIKTLCYFHIDNVMALKTPSIISSLLFQMTAVPRRLETAVLDMAGRETMLTLVFV